MKARYKRMLSRIIEIFEMSIVAIITYTISYALITMLCG